MKNTLFNSLGHGLLFFVLVAVLLAFLSSIISIPDSFLWIAVVAGVGAFVISNYIRRN